MLGWSMSASVWRSASNLATTCRVSMPSLMTCVAVHPTHSLARARKVSLEQVANERLIGFAFADYPEYHLSFANLFAPLKRVPQIAEEHDSSTSLIAAVEAGRGVALVLQGFD